MAGGRKQFSEEFKREAVRLEQGLHRARPGPVLGPAGEPLLGALLQNVA